MKKGKTLYLFKSQDNTQVLWIEHVAVGLVRWAKTSTIIAMFSTLRLPGTLDRTCRSRLSLLGKD